MLGVNWGCVKIFIDYDFVLKKNMEKKALIALGSHIGSQLDPTRPTKSVASPVQESKAKQFEASGETRETKQAQCPLRIHQTI